MQCFLQQQSGLGNICADNVLYRSRRQFDDPRDIGESGRERERERIVRKLQTGRVFTVLLEEI